MSQDEKRNAVAILHNQSLREILDPLPESMKHAAAKIWRHLVQNMAEKSDLLVQLISDRSPYSPITEDQMAEYVQQIWGTLNFSLPVLESDEEEEDDNREKEQEEEELHIATSVEKRAIPPLSFQDEMEEEEEELHIPVEAKVTVILVSYENEMEEKEEKEDEVEVEELEVGVVEVAKEEEMDEEEEEEDIEEVEVGEVELAKEEEMDEEEDEMEEEMEEEELEEEEMEEEEEELHIPRRSRRSTRRVVRLSYQVEMEEEEEELHIPKRTKKRVMPLSCQEEMEEEEKELHIPKSPGSNSSLVLHLRSRKVQKKPVEIPRPPAAKRAVVAKKGSGKKKPSGKKAGKAGKFKCRFCDVTLKYYNNILRHEDEQHLNKVDIQCPKCPQHFTIKRNYLEHLIAAHSKNPRRYICPYCGRVDTIRQTAGKHKQNCPQRP